MSTEYPPPPDVDAQEQTLRQIAADVHWLRAEMHCVEASIDNLSKSLARLVDALAELEPEDEDEPALTLDGEPAGEPRDQDAPL